MNLGHVFDGAVARYRDRIAFSDAHRGITFGKLDERTRRLGNSLAALGLTSGSRIATLQYNSIELIELDIAAARFGYVRTLLNARAEDRKSTRLNSSH